MKYNKTEVSKAICLIYQLIQDAKKEDLDCTAAELDSLKDTYWLLTDINIQAKK